MKNNNQIRIPRPYGLTQAMQNLKSLDPSQHNKQKDKVINLVIEQYISTGFQLNKKPTNITELAIYLNIETTDALRRVNKQMGRVANYLNGQEGIDLARVFSNRAIFWALEIGALTEQQVRILSASQSGSYKPFITTEMNKAIANLIAAGKLKVDVMGKLIDALKAGQNSPNGAQSINLLGPSTAQSQTLNGQYLDTEKAIKLLEEKGQITAISDAQNGKDLSGYLGPNELKSLPEVRANHQDLSAIGIKQNKLKDAVEGTQTDDPGASKKVSHEDRRAKDFNLLDDEDLEDYLVADE